MNVLSLFDGMSCGQIALDRLGIKVDKYYASEIEKPSIKVTKKNYPNTIHLGDVTKIKGGDLEPIDLLIGGSPCQGFSFAGKQLNFDDERSKLFFEYTRLIKECKPKYFFLENVDMQQEYQDVINKELGCRPITINSRLVSAQNRKRLYWTNIPFAGMPEDKGIMFDDILETSGAIGRVVGRRINDMGKRADNDKDVECVQAFEPKIDGKSGCLTTVPKDNMVIESKYYVSDKQMKRIDVGSIKRCGGVSFERPGKEWEKCSALLARHYKGISGKQHYPVIKEIDGLRKLTPLECERLQTVPDNYTEVLYTNKIYKYVGNNKSKDCLWENVKLGDVNGMSGLINSENCVLNITRGLLDMERPIQLLKQDFQKLNVNIVIEKLERRVVEQEECVIDITKIGTSMETLYTRIKKEMSSVLGGMSNVLMVRSITGKLLKITLVGNYQEKKSFIMLIVLRMIIELKICTYVNQKVNIRLCIDNLNDYLMNSSNVVLSNLIMEHIISKVSDTARYKMLGNGWTVDVIAHLFKGLKKDTNSLRRFLK